VRVKALTKRLLVPVVVATICILVGLYWYVQEILTSAVVLSVVPGCSSIWFIVSSIDIPIAAAPAIYACSKLLLAATLALSLPSL
jgi:precorrin-2 methylase